MTKSARLALGIVGGTLLAGAAAIGGLVWMASRGPVTVAEDEARPRVTRRSMDLPSTPTAVIRKYGPPSEDRTGAINDHATPKRAIDYRRPGLRLVFERSEVPKVLPADEDGWRLAGCYDLTTGTKIALNVAATRLAGLE